MDLHNICAAVYSVLQFLPIPSFLLILAFLWASGQINHSEEHYEEQSLNRNTDIS